MVCRNKDKAEEARADIVKETGNKVTPLLSRPFPNQTFITLNVITGSPCPPPGPFGDQEGVGICRGLQEKVQGPQCAGESDEAFHVPLLLWRSFSHFRPTSANCIMLNCLQINNAGSIMSQREVNAEGLEKSFATNVLGESDSEQRWEGRMGGWARKIVFYSLILFTRSLHSHQESHSSAGEERRPQSGESGLPFSDCCWCKKQLQPVLFRDMNLGCGFLVGRVPSGKREYSLRLLVVFHGLWIPDGD